MQEFSDPSGGTMDHPTSQINWRQVSSAVLLSLAVGCGETSTPSATAEREWTAPESTAASPQTVERSSLHADSNIELASATSAGDERPIKGSPEWLLTEIAQLRKISDGRQRSPDAERPGQLDEGQLAAEQVRHYQKTIELAMQAISKTHEAPANEKLFNIAVHYLVDARLQLALAGNAEQAQWLDENAKALFTRDATSFAAVEAGSHVLQLTRTMADRHAAEDPQWAIAFANQARLFAEHFPQESSRAAVNVIAAGRLCEQMRLTEEARACYAFIEQTYPNSPYAAQVAGPWRRLQLPGHRLQEFGGSTFDGGFVSMSQLQGQPLLIAFWASNSAEFQADLPALQSLLRESGGRLNIIGVNLDRDERAVDQFLKQHDLRWKQIFFSDPEKRGARNVVAQHYGVVDVPQYWLVDAEGIVRSIDLDRTQLRESVFTALRNP